MVSLSLFAIVIMVSLGSILGIFDANRKSRSLKSVMTNLNLAIEEMSKEMRYGRTYHCGSSGTLTLPQNCPTTAPYMTFLASDNATQVAYRFTGTTLERQENGGSWTAVVGPEVVLDNYFFYVTGATAGDSYQPLAFIYVKGHTGSGAGRSDFSLETIVSQRALDH
jgi:type II secretory pathway pseudopilin PulG